MNLMLLRTEVRRVLRDETFPSEEVDAAINRVIQDINASGRYRFHEATHSVTLTTNTATYAVQADILAEHALVWKAFTADQVVLHKMTDGLSNALDLGLFQDTGNNPERYLRWGGLWYLDPVPNSAASGTIITIFSMKDLVKLYSPADTCALPARHDNVLIYGAAAQINPNLRPDGPKGVSISQMFNTAFAGMRTQEKWNPDEIYLLKRGPRWNTASTWGNVGTIGKR